ncbi:MAG TPA: glycosyltransferase family 4 protein [Actinomycetota bacterium]
MRALFVAPTLPTPGSGGRTRLTSITRLLAERHDLHLVGYTAEDQSPDENPYPGAALPPPPLPPRPAGLAGALRFYRERLTTTLPAFVSYLAHPAMRAAIVHEIARFDPDVVQVETTEMAHYLRWIPRRPVRALDLQDVASRWFATVVAQDQTRKERALNRLELLKARRYDARYARMPDIVFSVSEEERSFLRAHAGVEAVPVPNGVDTEAFAPLRGVEPDPAKLVFVGPLTYVANRDGLGWFVEQVLPKVLAEDPAVRLDVVGTPVEVSWPDSVRLLGRVEDVRPHVAGAAIGIVPIRIGSGTRYKILEALSMGSAVVSTSLGAEGLGTVHGTHLLLADDAGSFADAILELRRSAELRARLGAAGRAHVAEHFDWRPLVERIEDAWTGARERRGHP